MSDQDSSLGPGWAIRSLPQPLTRGDARTLAHLSGSLFGDGYLTARQLQMEAPAVLLAIVDGNIAGWTTAYRWTGQNETPPRYYAMLQALDAPVHWPLHVLGEIAVLPGYRRRGIGTALLREALARHRHWATLLWDRSDGAPNPFLRLAEANGFSGQKRIPRYWEADSLQRKYVCPACQGTCHCDALLMWR
ncbi:GNAT family N-acetyltransferase [Thiomonas sp.]